MKLFVYSYRTFDEDVYFREFSKEYGVELGICHQGPSMENAHLAEGYDYISILTSKINAALVRRFRELGVKMISTRTRSLTQLFVRSPEFVFPTESK